MLLDSIVDIGSKVIDKIFPDKIQAEQAKIKLLELQQQGEFKVLETQLAQDKLDVENTASARLRETDMAKVGKRDWTQPILALIIAIGFFGLLTLMMYVDIDSDIKSPLEIMLGALGMSFATVVNYYFGSSKDARKIENKKTTNI